MAKKHEPEAALVLCDADGNVVKLVPEPTNGHRPFRFKDSDGRMYEHSAEDSMGRWVYLPMVR